MSVAPSAPVAPPHASCCCGNPVGDGQSTPKQSLRTLPLCFLFPGPVLVIDTSLPFLAFMPKREPGAVTSPTRAFDPGCRLSGRRVTFEYTLLAGVNDGAAHAQELGALLRRHDLRSHVNVIPWNPVDESGEPSRH